MFDIINILSYNGSMACLSAWRRSMLITRRDNLTAQITSINTVIDAAILSGKVNSIEFDSGEGKQKTSYRSLNELQKMVDGLEIRLDQVLNALRGAGVVNMGLKR